MSDRHSAREFLALLTDDFTELPAEPPTASASSPADDGPIGWPGYGAARQRARQRTGEDESVVCGTAHIGATRAVVLCFEFGFLGGSIGERTGARIEAAHIHARRHRLPVLSLIATGGSRMQEGMRALAQLQRIVRQAALTRQAGLPQLAVLRDPATGGGWAVLGPSADVILALPNAQVGFAGSRVRPADADPSAYTAESQLAHGHIDAIVPLEALRDKLSHWLHLLTTPAAEPAEVPAALASPELPVTGWQAVTAARAAHRPRAVSYLDAYFDAREPVSGDRLGDTDPGLLCGFGSRSGVTIAYAAQTGSRTTPSGFRTASRLIRTADRLGIPVLTLIDTPGAANDAASERAGTAAAIAELFTTIAEVTIPMTTLLIGEGGSGGAMALASPSNTWATPDSYFAVIAPKRPPRSSNTHPEPPPRSPNNCGCAPRTCSPWASSEASRYE